MGRQCCACLHFYTVLRILRMVNSKSLNELMNKRVNVAASFFYFYHGLFFFSKPFWLQLCNKRAFLICFVLLCLYFFSKKTFFWIVSIAMYSNLLLSFLFRKKPIFFYLYCTIDNNPQKRRMDHFRNTAKIHWFRWQKFWISNTMHKSSQFSKLSLYSANWFCK